MSAWLLALCLGWTTQARELFMKGFVEVRPGHKLYVEHKPARNGKPTAVLVNGLTYSTRQWRTYADKLLQLDPDLGLVLYDMEGMGETLLANAPIDFDIPMENQTRDLRDLLHTLNLVGAKYLIGLSYGGAVVMDFARRYDADADVDGYIAMAPFLERLKSQDDWIKSRMVWHRLWERLMPHMPVARLTDDELYDFYLKVLVTTTYPAAEPIILENPYKLEAIYRMVKGAKNWNALAIGDQLPERKLHVIAARDDIHVQFDRIQAFLATLPTDRVASVAIFKDTRHKVPEDHPAFTAAWTLEILTRNPKLSQGLTFIAEPHRGEARSGDTVIGLPKETFCELALRRTLKPF